MEATVNMKMSPAEHRLLREAVEEASDTAHQIAHDKDKDPGMRRLALQREASLDLLLERL